MSCPICRTPVAHPSLDRVLAPLRAVQRRVLTKLAAVLEVEGTPVDASLSAGARDAALLAALPAFDFYMCFRCTMPYYGGRHLQCNREGPAGPAEEQLCGACMAHVSGARCDKHGDEFVQFKCRYCCTPAVWFCFGSTHFCNKCHEQHERMKRMGESGELPHCPAGPCGVQLPGDADACPLGVVHAPTGKEHILGCVMCARERTLRAAGGAGAPS